MAREWWEANGYIAGKQVEGGLWVCLAPQLFTFRLMVCDPDCVHDFYCYPHLADALVAYNTWDGTGDPAEGWIKHHATGRRRQVTV